MSEFYINGVPVENLEQAVFFKKEHVNSVGQQRANSLFPAGLMSLLALYVVIKRDPKGAMTQERADYLWETCLAMYGESLVVESQIDAIAADETKSEDEKIQAILDIVPNWPLLPGELSVG